jgi:hypothetical protein
MHKLTRFTTWVSVLVFLLGVTGHARATHIMGGEITWNCQGNGAYVFELVVYRDCNGFDVSTGNETIQVWNHPSVSSITVSFFQRIDISPVCTPVAGGPNPFLCGAGANGGNGSGAVEKVIYRSNPVVLTGNPPAQGWIFTYKSFSRSGNLTNVQNPLTVGITIVAKMFTTGANGTCNDSSPRFLEVPFIVSCAGQPFVYNQNAYDPDLDSLVFSWGVPYDQVNTTFNPPLDPVPVQFEPGFSFSSPTPGVGLNPANIPASINPSSGELTFTSFSTGNFAVKLLVHAYRNGILISEVQREMQVIVENCAQVNAAPIVTPPFGGTSFETTVFAGELVNFQVLATDNGLLQDGSPQSVSIQASGAQFGANFTNAAAGCPEPPCAVLNTNPPVTGSPSALLDFSWQTTCDHLIGASGVPLDEVPYYFVFRVQDDVCQIPAVRYVTVTVNLRNRGVLPATSINCIQVQPNGDVFLSWDAVPDPENSFVSYEIYSPQHGLVGTLFDVNATSLTHPGANANAGPVEYYVVTNSGCEGLVSMHSDTVSSIFMTLNNPGNGTAVVQWTAPGTLPFPADWNAYYYVMQEYPAGTWSLVDSVAVGLGSFVDTIDICSAFLNYRIELPGSGCAFISNTEGDNFQDQIGPNIPVIQSVTVDTITGLVTITWNQNQAPDTYGYIIYAQDANGFYIDLDTVWGIGNTSYVLNANTGIGPLSFSVAAFDSCYTPQTPPTFQTSAKANVHTTHFLSGTLDICAQAVNLNWTPYQGWVEGVQGYRIFAYRTGEPWELLATTDQLSRTLPVQTETNYCFVVEAFSSEGRTAFCNLVCIDIVSPAPPELHYLSTATVEEGNVRVRHYTSLPVEDGALIFERLNPQSNVFETLETRTVTGMIEDFMDEEASPEKRSYAYRVTAVDSCGRPSLASNVGKTIHLTTRTDDVRMIVHLQWTAYESWLGPIIQYRIHRGIDAVIDPNPIAVVSPSIRSYEDNVEEFLTSSGQFCYYVVAVEGTNVLGIQEFSASNASCAVIEPLIYIPNAFTVGGKNPVFKPVVNLFDYNRYEFTVFDRWGQAIFRTNDPNEGWKGDISGRGIAREGLYLYVLRLYDANGEEYTRRGHVTLLNYTGVDY